MSLNSSQQVALDALMKFILDPKERYFILEGPAGVGKTFLLNHLHGAIADYYAGIEFLTGKYERPLEFQPTATTNPAVEKLLIAETPATTIHSFLELTVQTNYSTGKTQLLPRRGSKGPIYEPYLIVIDEGSYLDNTMLSFLESRTHPESKIIIMGDDCQLTSPETNMAPAFSKGFTQVSLNEQVRQDPNSALGQLCLALRGAVRTGEIPQFDLVPSQIEYIEDHGLWFDLAKTEMLDQLWMPTESRIIAWRNKTVISYNNSIVHSMTGDTIPYPGQYLTSNRPIAAPNGNIIVPNNGTVLVHSVKPTTSYLWPVYEIEYFFKNTKHYGYMPVSHSHFAEAKKIGLEKQDTKMVQAAMELWLDLRPAYASTVDKAQGSTYDKVFVNLSDIAACRNYNRVLRMLYTATSRAKQTVYFYGDLNG